jgi:hypothetical protein
VKPAARILAACALLVSVGGASRARGASCAAGDTLDRVRSAHGQLESRESIAVLDDLPFDAVHAPPGARKPLPAFDSKDPQPSL